MIFVTGGAGFIGSNFVLNRIRRRDESIVNIDKMTYAANPKNLLPLKNDSRHMLIKGDIGDSEAMSALLRTHKPRAVVHFAAESHVDRSILGPAEFIATNITGTFVLLDACRAYWSNLPAGEKAVFRFLHVSTDEVYGSLGPADPPFSETTPYAPNSPYSASKAASDHLVRAYFHTYGMPVLTTNCSNNYGPYQHPEKLIPLVIANAVSGKPLPLYGDGRNVRDWLYVEDHCAAIERVLEHGRPGETYNIGGWSERSNIEVVHAVCDILDRMRPAASGASYREQIRFVKDRPGHDRRYAIDARKIERELGWKPAHTFEDGLADTVRWYLDHWEWLEDVQRGGYREWTERNYRKRDTMTEVA